jgi:hypothetical protein
LIEHLHRLDACVRDQWSAPTFGPHSTGVAGSAMRQFH